MLQAIACVADREVQAAQAAQAAQAQAAAAQAQAQAAQAQAAQAMEQTMVHAGEELGPCYKL